MARNLPRQDIPVYAHDPYLVVGIDAVESDRHQRPCLDNAPDLIPVDEALGRRDPQFDAPTTQVARLNRRKPLPRVVQRRRSDVVTRMTADTPFPQRPSDEVVDHLSPDYRDPFNDVLEDRRETIAAGEGLRAARQGGRHGAAITLLRGLLSSPQTAETVLENRQKRLVAEGEDRVEATEEDLDATYRPRIMGALGGGKSAKANGARTLMSLFKRGIRRIRFNPRTYAPIPLLWTDWVS